MSIMPAGGWGVPKEGEIVPTVVKPEPSIIFVHTESKHPSAFGTGFGGCLVIICALLLGGVAVVVLVKVMISMPRTKTRQTQSAEIVTVPAPTLEAAYATNEVAAEAKYGGKTLRVSGVLDNISKGPLGDTHVYLAGMPVELGGSLIGVDATMDSGTDEVAAQLRPWENIVLLCGQVHRIVGYVSLNNCVFDLTAMQQRTVREQADPTSPNGNNW